MFRPLDPFSTSDKTSLTSSSTSSFSSHRNMSIQPNDLWRFFSGLEHPSEKAPSTKSAFVEEHMLKDDAATSRWKEVLDVLEIYETATSSWGDRPSRSSRGWFSAPENGFEAAEDTEPRKQRMAPFSMPVFENMSRMELLEQIPAWRIQSAAVYLSKQSKEALFEQCPPKLNRIAGDHMTLMHGPDASTLIDIPLGKNVKLIAFGEKCGIVAQHVALKPMDDLPILKTRPHVTVSFADRVLKRDIAAMKGNGTFDKWVFPLQLEGTIGFKMDNGKIVLSNEELFIETGIDLEEVRKLIETKDEIAEVLPVALEVETDDEPDTKPSEEIARLMAHDSFSSRPDEICAQIFSPTIEKESGLEMLSTSEPSCLEPSETRGILRLSSMEMPTLKVLRVSRTKTFAERCPSSPSKPFEQTQQDIKKKQAKLRAECEEYRQASWKEQRKSEEYLGMARTAYLEGRRNLGDQYNKISREAIGRQREHAEKAERLAFEASNLGRINTHTIDLHHLYLQEAIARLKSVINGLSAFVEDIQTTYRLRIITGKGMNSVDNVPVLRPAVLEYLKANGLASEVDESNEGVILAYICPKKS